MPGSKPYIHASCGPSFNHYRNNLNINSYSDSFGIEATKKLIELLKKIDVIHATGHDAEKNW